MEWSNWNYINLAFVFINFYVAIIMFKDEREFVGHFNMFAVVFNGWIVASRLGF